MKGYNPIITRFDSERVNLMRSDHEKTYDLGVSAKALIELHLENPKQFNVDVVFRLLLERYEQLNLDPIEPYEKVKE